ncbi:MAG: helix-turn-helix transcriptional regulator [Clostridia bacterium]|nr:helix-turn-helix transcriptional regulator [Clostridia bacterium]
MLCLKEIRQRQHRTQAEVASFLNIARASYTNLENERRDLDTDTILALADFFNVSIDEIFGRKVETKKEHFSKDEIQLLEWYRSLNSKGRDLVRQTAYTAYASEIYKNDGDASGVAGKVI